jgi:hypothetical protein
LKKETGTRFLSMRCNGRKMEIYMFELELSTKLRLARSPFGVSMARMYLHSCREMFKIHVTHTQKASSKTASETPALRCSRFPILNRERGRNNQTPTTIEARAQQSRAWGSPLRRPWIQRVCIPGHTIYAVVLCAVDL